jgi:hypothetical protein
MANVNGLPMRTAGEAAIQLGLLGVTAPLAFQNQWNQDVHVPQKQNIVCPQQSHHVG